MLILAENWNKIKKNNNCQGSEESGETFLLKIAKIYISITIINTLHLVMIWIDLIY